MVHPLISVLVQETIWVQLSPNRSHFLLDIGQTVEEVISGYDHYNQGIPDVWYILPIQVLKHSQSVSSNNTFRIKLTWI